MPFINVPAEQPPYSQYIPLIYRAALPDAMAARNVILVIGDGMGFGHVEAGGLFANGTAGSLSFEQFPCRAEMTTSSVSGITDSAAAATAMASGVKVLNGVLGLALPGDGHELRSILEYARDQGRATGLVTTAPITHATPAGFGAHALNRELVDEIASDLLAGSHPNILFGGGGEGITPAAALAASYNLVTNRNELLSLKPDEHFFLSGQFGVGGLPYEYDGLGELPHLREMTRIALRVLDNDPDGFFLMVEGGKVDWAAHSNDITRVVAEMKELSNTVDEVMGWAAGRSDTLVLVVADHETGGLQVLAGRGAGQVPLVSWATTGHSAATVPVYLTGVDCSVLTNGIDNTQIPAILSGGKFP